MIKLGKITLPPEPFTEEPLEASAQKNLDDNLALFQTPLPANYSHPHLANRWLTVPDSLRPSAVGTDLVAIYRNIHGVPRGAQFLFSGRDASGMNKTTLAGSKVKGAFWSYSSVENPEFIYVCEGISTAIALAKLVDIPNYLYVAAGSRTNLAYVTQALYEKYPNSGLFLCADTSMGNAIDKLEARARDALTAECFSADILLPPLRGASNQDWCDYWMQFAGDTNRAHAEFWKEFDQQTKLENQRAYVAQAKQAYQEEYARVEQAKEDAKKKQRRDKAKESRWGATLEPRLLHEAMTVAIEKFCEHNKLALLATFALECDSRGFTAKIRCAEGDIVLERHRLHTNAPELDEAALRLDWRTCFDLYAHARLSDEQEGELAPVYESPFVVDDWKDTVLIALCKKWLKEYREGKRPWTLLEAPVGIGKTEAVLRIIFLVLALERSQAKKARQMEWQEHVEQHPDLEIDDLPPCQYKTKLPPLPVWLAPDLHLLSDAEKRILMQVTGTDHARLMNEIIFLKAGVLDDLSTEARTYYLQDATAICSHFTYACSRADFLNCAYPLAVALAGMREREGWLFFIDEVHKFIARTFFSHLTKKRVKVGEGGEHDFISGCPSFGGSYGITQGKEPWKNCAYLCKNIESFGHYTGIFLQLYKGKGVTPWTPRQVNEPISISDPHKNELPSVVFKTEGKVVEVPRVTISQITGLDNFAPVGYGLIKRPPPYSFEDWINFKIPTQYDVKSGHGFYYDGHYLAVLGTGALWNPEVQRFYPTDIDLNAQEEVRLTQEQIAQWKVVTARYSKIICDTDIVKGYIRFAYDLLNTALGGIAMTGTLPKDQKRVLTALCPKFVAEKIQKGAKKLKKLRLIFCKGGVHFEENKRTLFSKVHAIGKPFLWVTAKHRHLEELMESDQTGMHFQITGLSECGDYISKGDRGERETLVFNFRSANATGTSYPERKVMVVNANGYAPIDSIYLGAMDPEIWDKPPHEQAQIIKNAIEKEILVQLNQVRGRSWRWMCNPDGSIYQEDDGIRICFQLFSPTERVMVQKFTHAVENEVVTQKLVEIEEEHYLLPTAQEMETFKELFEEVEIIQMPTKGHYSSALIGYDDPETKEWHNGAILRTLIDGNADLSDLEHGTSRESMPTYKTLIEGILIDIRARFERGEKKGRIESALNIDRFRLKTKTGKRSKKGHTYCLSKFKQALKVIETNTGRKVPLTQKKGIARQIRIEQKAYLLAVESLWEELNSVSKTA